MALELSKEAQAKLQEAQQELHAQAEAARGLEKFVLRGLERSLGGRLPGLIDQVLSKAGIGLEHCLDQVEAAIERDELVIRIAGHRGIRLSLSDVGIASAQEFLAKLEELRRREDRSHEATS